MTEDYKKTLLDYATNTLDIQQPSQEIDVESETPMNRIYRQQIQNELGVLNVSFGKLIATKNSQDEYTKETIVWGSYYPNSSYDVRDLRSFIALVDRDFNLIKLFDDYDNIQNKVIQDLAVDENGNLYGIDGVPQSDGSIKNVRFIMLSNPTVQDSSGEYNLRLRYSTYLPNDSGLTTIRRASIMYLDKAIGSSKYVIGVLGTSLGQCFAELQINVGSANEWHYYKTYDSYASGYTDAFTYWDEDTLKIKFLSFVVFSSPNNADLYMFELNGGGTFTRSLIYRESYSNINPSIYGIFKSYNEFVFSVYRDDSTSIYRYLDNSYSLIYTINITDSYIHNYVLRKLEDIIYMTEIIYNSGEPYGYYLYIIDLNGVYKINIMPDVPVGVSTYFDNTIFVDRKEFNLITIDCDYYLPDTQYNSIRIKLIYNQNQYNGEAYTNEDALSPLLSNLYSNGSLEFSRNVYNISKQNNMTMSSVEIPNSYLNDLTITRNDLLSETNLPMNQNSQQWTKNVYEVVDLNFLNTIRVIDEDTDTEYLESAIKLNEATTDGGATNYLNTPCNKYRINYLDGTTSIDNLFWTTIDDTHKETQITLFVDAPMLSIDFISNDESTIYLNIPLDVEENKTYTISQKIRIGE